MKTPYRIVDTDFALDTARMLNLLSSDENEEWFAQRKRWRKLKHAL